jgi:hypothetical protein
VKSEMKKMGGEMNTFYQGNAIWLFHDANSIIQEQ